jgi:hypothetical protein
MFVGAKHDRNQYGMITNNLSAVMLRPPQKPDAPVEGASLGNCCSCFQNSRWRHTLQITRVLFDEASYTIEKESGYTTIIRLVNSMILEGASL